MSEHYKVAEVKVRVGELFEATPFTYSEYVKREDLINAFKVAVERLEKLDGVELK